MAVSDALRAQIADDLARAEATAVGIDPPTASHPGLDVVDAYEIQLINIRRRLDARKASFAPMDFAVEATGMEYGGITPVGAPPGWPIWVDGAVADAAGWLCIGSGIRGSKLFLSAADLLALPAAQRVDDLARLAP